MDLAECMKALWFGLLYIWTAVALAQTTATTTAATVDPNKVKTMIKEAGKPVEIVFNDGRVIELKLHEVYHPLKSSMTLSTNTCTRTLGDKMEFVMPLIHRSLIPVWKTHPTKQGQFVLDFDEENKRDEVASDSAFYNPMKAAEFNDRLKALKPTQIDDRPSHNIATQLVGKFGWMDCAGACPATLLPESKTVRFWDENFETGNEGATMVRGMEEISFNQMTSRLQEVDLTLAGDKIYFANPKETFGYLALFFSAGITYQIQWYFEGKNLIDENDSLCEMRWDVDFTRVFTDFTAVGELVTNVEKARTLKLEPYLFDPRDDEHIQLQYPLSASRWEDGELHR